ncbi:DUF4328 domain-containing protein [Panacibacter ginsenosidivorans]|uniref:DUF4328 domain-containing protein n=1 Tax=Panacibacter ginsenosidivorans TaxID=1813871 RepID=A0A5B8VDN9_9BACT|nr:DUF4328 domain-containing protein [Panacibacter ginsenosidivorans]QEC69647.1 DUF4328 domain-containing protein [Panacibacter ginsenosidivorans]
MAPFKNNILSRFIILVLFIETIAIFLYLGFSVYKLLFFKKVLQGSTILSGETTLIGDINKMSFRIIIYIFVSGILLFLCWIYRLYRNIEASRNIEHGFTPFTRVLALVIPFANLFIPRRVVNEIFNIYTISEREKYTARRILNKWRYQLALVIIYSLYCIFIFYAPASVTDVIKGIYYKIFLLVLCIHFSFLTMEIVEMLNELERKKLFLFPGNVDKAPASQLSV